MCTGCARACRYRDFKDPDGITYQELYRGLWKDDPDPSSWRYKRRRTILGMMHQAKREAWERSVRACLEAQSAMRDALVSPSDDTIPF